MLSIAYITCKMQVDVNHRKTAEFHNFENLQYWIEKLLKATSMELFGDVGAYHPL